MKSHSKLDCSTGTTKRALATASAFLVTAVSIFTPPAVASSSVFLCTSSVGASSVGAFAGGRSKHARGRVPGRRRGGARRGSCAETKNPLVALVAAVEVETQTLPETYVGGITTAERPTFWFDVPYALNDETTAEFVLQNEQGQDIYRTTSAEFAPFDQTPGVMGISLPETLEALTIGQTYHWYFKVNCGTDSPLYVQGGVERTALSLDLANQLSMASPVEQAELYQANEIWYDAVSAIAPMYVEQENDPIVSAAWAELLRSLSLDQM